GPAARTARRLQALEPAKPAGWVLEANVWIEAGDPKSAAEAARRALAVDGRDREATVALARAELALEDADAARGLLTAALPRNRRYRPLLLELGRVELADGRPAEAQRWL